jgi:dsDNA-specific endonuclease/ATPase MutS2
LSPFHLPIDGTLDLHPFDPRDVKGVVEDYVTAAFEAGLMEIRIVHGRGRGVQRGIVQSALERHPYVVEFWDDPSSHLGATIARLGQ